MLTREEAINKGFSTYSNCSACYKGHPPCRYVKTGKCVHCHRDKAKWRRLTGKGSYMRSLGLVYKKFYLHPDDVEKFKAFCQALRIDRGIFIDPE